MTDKRFFPLGLATGPAFCNRTDERRALAERITNGRHSWLTAPRRYGKTSLIEQTRLDMQREKKGRLAAEAVDLLLVHDEESMLGLLFEAVGRLVSSLIPRQRRLADAVAKYFRGLSPEVQLGGSGLVTVRFRPRDTGMKTISDLLTGLDRLAADNKVRALLVLDEFQQLATLRENHAIEASVRHAVERAGNITYLFSGSHRHMLAQMFEDRARPLYHLCERFTLERIDAPHYRRYIARAARWRWKALPTEAAVDAILAVTARHPYYVNCLCGRLWRDDKPPHAADVFAQWERYVGEERARVGRELLDLSPNQRSVLQAIAEEPTQQPRSREFLERTRLASASAGQAVQVLLEKDVVEADADGFLRVMDPAVQWTLQPVQMP